VPVYQGKCLWGTNTKELLQIGYMARAIIEEGERQGIPLRWGGDFDQNETTMDESFTDAFHTELG
jgi:hypothetical protein